MKKMKMRHTQPKKKKDEKYEKRELERAPGEKENKKKMMKKK